MRLRALGSLDTSINNKGNTSGRGEVAKMPTSFNGFVGRSFCQLQGSDSI